MFKRFFRFIMAFQANNIKSPSREKSRGVSLSKKKQKDLPMVDLTQKEVELILSALQSSTFTGDLIEILYILTNKLKQHHQKLR